MLQLTVKPLNNPWKKCNVMCHKSLAAAPEDAPWYVMIYSVETNRLSVDWLTYLFTV